MSDLLLEADARAAGHAVICGVDEAGRGPLAGPVVAAACILGPDAPAGLDDSKALSSARRGELFAAILATCEVAVASASAATIDRINVRAATLDAMGRAVAALPRVPDLALIDGDALPPLPCSGRAVVGGDALSASISAASIVAKVVRDRMMVRADAHWPAYGFAAHKGYGVAAHRAALKDRGACVLHRRSFAPVRAVLER